MNKKNTKIIFIILVFVSVGFLFSQNPSAPNRTPPPPPGIPIDGGILTLITIGAGYALSKLRNKK